MKSKYKQLSYIVSDIYISGGNKNKFDFLRSRLARIFSSYPCRYLFALCVIECSSLVATSGYKICRIFISLAAVRVFSHLARQIITTNRHQLDREPYTTAAVEVKCK